METIFIGSQHLQNNSGSISGKYVIIEGEKYFKITNYHQMRPFFMSLVSHSDHWLFTSSNGGLTAGRKNSEHALFPYTTDDKITDSAENTGGKTIIRVYSDDKQLLWEPFSIRYEGTYTFERNIYKNVSGNKIIFEEINHDLKLSFSYSWKFSEQYGFVRQSNLLNSNKDKVKVELLDGIQNIVPSGVNSALLRESSNLTNAYKKSELEKSSGIGLFMLSAMIVDRAEPSEALKTTTVWSSGINPANILLSNRQLDGFRKGGSIETERDVKAEPGAYFVHSILTLDGGQSEAWYIVSELDQDHGNVIELVQKLEENREIFIEELVNDIDKGTNQLRRLVGLADGLQMTNDQLSCGRHFSNVLFNIMRGGIFDDQYKIDKHDYVDYINQINRIVLSEHPHFFNGLNDSFSYQDLIEKANNYGDPVITRLSYEYLPLTFSRRHGDPSRPWNQFSIETKKEDGSKNRSYEGNWRDIFQNWEALSMSFPGYLPSMITKFVNASTIDGYNPYRITREGIDWEVIEPDNPWSYIGYWGDHQIIYLLKLLELAKEHYPERLYSLLSQEHFVYANVPYRIKSYDDIVANPQDTIVFDEALEEKIEQKVAALGGDGKLVYDLNGNLLQANLMEKLLVSMLAKVSNFIPEAGIWLNTQRPEWNDANNALVGNGVSMVTLYYLRRFVSFFIVLLDHASAESYQLHTPVAKMFLAIKDFLKQHQGMLNDKFSDENRKLFIERLGRIGEEYRNDAYQPFGNKKESISSSQLIDLLNITQQYIDHSIKANKREDELYHAYNLINIKDDQASIRYLYEMLEGQVAVLSSGMLNAEDSLKVLDALKRSAIYREDQYSYLLYPDRELPRFLHKNKVPKTFVDQSTLAQKLITAGDTSVIKWDIKGDYHFNGNFRNASDLKAALDHLKETSYQDMTNREYQDFLNVFEEVFDHQSFTGRSGTFYGYEGLGSIYWHMVSKLLLATQETIKAANHEKASADIIGHLIEHYYEIRAGIGINKSPELYGAFPTDPYSHTPGNKGAQQPGMTGQVKEDIVNRWAEFGVVVHDGTIQFNPTFLNDGEYHGENSTFEYFDLHGNQKKLELNNGALAFTYCQVPVIYRKSDKSSIEVKFITGAVNEIEAYTLPKDLSEMVFKRSGDFEFIKVNIQQ